MNPRPPHPRAGAALALTIAAAACTTPTNPAPGCRPWVNQTLSTEPPTHCLFFPTGLALDPLGDVMYVSNGNTDLSFAGGTVAAVDLLRYEHAVACYMAWVKGQAVPGCASPFLCDALTPRTSCVPGSCGTFNTRLTPDSTLEDVAAAERDILAHGMNAQTISAPSDLDWCFCNKDLIDPNIVNCDTDRFVLRDQTVKTGNFAAQVHLVAEDPPDWGQLYDPAAHAPAAGAPSLHRGLYLPVRGDPSITFVEVSRPAPFDRRPQDNPGLSITCGPPRGPNDPITYCDNAHRVQQTPDQMLVDPTDPTQGTVARILVPPEPFGLAMDRGCLLPGYTHPRGAFAGDPESTDPAAAWCYSPDGKQAVRTVEVQITVNDQPATITMPAYYQFLVATHFSGADLTAYRVGGNARRPGIPELADVRSGLFTPDAADRRGVFDVAPRIPGDLSQSWYSTGRMDGKLATFRLINQGIGPTRGPTIVPGQPAVVSNQFAGTGLDLRALIFEPGGDRAFVTVESPPAVLVMDTRPDPLATPAGSPRNVVTDVVDLIAGPYRMALSRTPQAVAGQPPRTVSRLYVSNYADGKVDAVELDPTRLGDVIVVGRGPYFITLNYGGEPDGGQVDPCADPYVSDAVAAGRGVTCPADAALRVRPDGKNDLGPRAYVLTIVDNAIAVIDLDPRSPTYHRVVSRIGKPLPKQGM